MTKPKCAVCTKHISGGSAYFSFGAVVDLLILRKNRLTETVIEGFCHIGYHGSRFDMSDSANYCVAEDVKGGQLDIQFCSLVCLRRWFNDIVDYLESQSGSKQRRRTPAQGTRHTEEGKPRRDE